MSILAVLAFVGAGLCAICAGMILWRHWKEIQLLDPLSIKEEQERLQRGDLMKRRFERVRADRVQPLKRFGRKLGLSLLHGYRKTYQRLQALEAMYKNVKTPFAPSAPSARERIKTLLQEAKSLSRDLKWAEAERRYLEILSLEPKQPDAYQGLGQIYLKQKLYPQAKETLEFVVKLKKADGATYAGLAEIMEAAGDRERAETYRLKAVAESPRQAHRHAELAAFYLEGGAPAKAWPSAKRASDLEPKSVKYLEISLEAAILLGDRQEARKRVERLRLFMDDPAKYQAWKEKEEGMEKRKSVL